MTLVPAKIIAINDGLIPEIDPLFVELREQFPNNEVIHFPNSNEGLNYVLTNLNQKMVVLLDINFSPGEKSGYEVLEDIRKKTSLVYIIMMTVRNLSEIPLTKLVSMINNDAVSLENSFNYSNVVNLVRDAMHKLDVRVDSVIEEWIMRHPPDKRNQVLIQTKEGKSYTMDQILEAIRLREPIGLEFEKNLLKLAIQIFSKQKLKTDD
ncbi:MAG: hypothetical protein ACKVOQ_08880 [Cyclobacteriaceae bacterium]